MSEELRTPNGRERPSWLRDLPFQKNSGKQSLPEWARETIGILRSRRGMTVLGILLGLVVLRVGANRLLRREAIEMVPRVHVIKADSKTIDLSLSLPGNIEAVEQASLYAHVSGYLRKLYVDEGDRVTKGQLLAEIEAPDIVQEYHKAKSQYGLKETTRKRYTELLNEKVVSQQEFDNIDADADTAKARFDNAASNLAYTRITAPFAGSIARRYKYPGDLISTTTTGNQSPLFVLVNESHLRVAINVPQADLAAIHIDDPVDIRVDALPDTAFPGKVSRLDALLDESTKTERALIDIDNPDGKLRAGMFASVSLHTAHRDHALVVPKDAQFAEGSHHFVYVVANRHITKREVTPGIADDASVEILKGVNPGETVVQGGLTGLTDGEAVDTIEEKKAN